MVQVPLASEPPRRLKVIGLSPSGSTALTVPNRLPVSVSEPAVSRASVSPSWVTGLPSPSTKPGASLTAWTMTLTFTLLPDTPEADRLASKSLLAPLV